jgi:5-methyltetrahydropteroyltriglutamate--homocysteine methyltransferase
MQRSTDKILTTHVGSLVRTRAIIEGFKARELKQPYDQPEFAAAVRSGVADVVAKQLEVGIDIPNDGEFSRPGYTTYINDRLGGLVPRGLEEGEVVFGHHPERQKFPEFFAQYDQHYRYLWMLPEVSLDDVPNLMGNHERFRVSGPITYTGQQAVERDIENLTAALHGHQVPDAFVTAATPVARHNDRDVLKFYPSLEAYLYAVADALHQEYRAIVDAGFVLQVDFGALNPRTQMVLLEKRNPSDDDVRRAIELGIDVLNHALRNIPEDRIRYHHCSGSMASPHTQDVPLREVVPLLLKIKAQAYVIEGANPRHEHEWMIWRDLKLPDGKILVPGVISHQTNVVEHPDLVAWRIQNFASVIGKENLIAGADCGFSQFWDSIRVHPSVQWAKLEALAQGAAIATRELWGRSD